jgi:rubrerythrin
MIETSPGSSTGGGRASSKVHSLLGRMASRVADRELCRLITNHCAEEAEHSRIWSEAITSLDLPHVQIHRSYQSLFMEQTSPPHSLVEVLAFTQVFEKRVHCHFHEELRDPELPGVVRSAYERMIEDEKGHLSWVATWLATRLEAPACLGRFAMADRAVLCAISSYADSLWEVPGLGSEIEPEVVAA